MVKIAPSILAADESMLEQEIMDVTNAGADYIHIDVMDGEFVPNITYGKRMIEAAVKSTNLPIDVHLMVKEPAKYIEMFEDASIITFHVEAVNYDEAEKIIEDLHGKNIKVGISIKPNTEVSELEKYINMIDMVLVMTVEPGFGGQTLIPSTLDKIRKLRELKPSLDIEVDGGINLYTAKSVVECGANILVAGTAIFKSDNRKNAIEKLKNIS